MCFSHSLPKDFFDAGISKEDGDSGDERGGVAAVRGSSEGEVQEAKTATAAVTESSEEGSRQAGGNSLPEGFFDDPKLDAKVITKLKIISIFSKCFQKLGT